MWIEFDLAVNAINDNDSIHVGFTTGCTGDFMYSSGSGATSGRGAQRTFFPSRIGSKQLNAASIRGDGITVAILDRGIWVGTGASTYLRKDRSGLERRRLCEL